MNLDILNNNFVIVFDRNISNSLKTDDLEIKVREVFMDKTPNPILTKFPQQVMLFIPEAQTSIVISQNSLVISDQIIGNFGKKNTARFITLLYKVIGLLGDYKIIAYGYNFTYQINGLVLSKIKSDFAKIVRPIAKNLPQDAKFDYVLPNLVFNIKSVKVSVNFTVNSDADGKEMDRLNININFHHKSTDLPDLADLNKDYTESEKYISAYIEKIFNEKGKSNVKSKK